MVRMNSLADALRCINNAEKRGKRQVMLRWDQDLLRALPFLDQLHLFRPCSKVVIRFLTVMMKHGYIGEFEVCCNLSMIWVPYHWRSPGRRWSSLWQNCGQPDRKAEQVRRDLAQVRVKLIFHHWTPVPLRFDIAINDIEKWTNNLLPSRQFGKVGQHY